MANEKTLDKCRMTQLVDTAKSWEDATVAPEKGEIVIYQESESQESKIKVGDGKTLVKDLPFVAGEIDNILSYSSENAVQNNIITGALSEKATPEDIRTAMTFALDQEVVETESNYALVDNSYVTTIYPMTKNIFTLPYFSTSVGINNMVQLYKKKKVTMPKGKYQFGFITNDDVDKKFSANINYTLIFYENVYNIDEEDGTQLTNNYFNKVKEEIGISTSSFIEIEISKNVHWVDLYINNYDEQIFPCLSYGEIDFTTAEISEHSNSNLFPYPTFYNVEKVHGSNVQLIDNKDGSYTIKTTDGGTAQSGTSKSYTRIQLLSGDETEYSAGYYTFYSNPSTNNEKVCMGFVGLSQDGKIEDYAFKEFNGGYLNDTNKNPIVFNAISPLKSIKAYINIKNGANLGTGITLKPTLSKGIFTADEMQNKWEPYGSRSLVQKCSKNLLRIYKPGTYPDTLNRTALANSTYMFEGTAVADDEIILDTYQQNLSAEGTYVLSGCENTVVDLIIDIVDSEGNTTSLRQGESYELKNGTVYTDKPRLVFNDEFTGTFIVAPQLEVTKDGKPTPFSRYYMPFTMEASEIRTQYSENESKEALYICEPQVKMVVETYKSYEDRIQTAEETIQSNQEISNNREHNMKNSLGILSNRITNVENQLLTKANLQDYNNTFLCSDNIDLNDWSEQSENFTIKNIDNTKNAKIYAYKTNYLPFTVVPGLTIDREETSIYVRMDGTLIINGELDGTDGAKNNYGYQYCNETPCTIKAGTYTLCLPDTDNIMFSIALYLKNSVGEIIPATINGSSKTGGVSTLAGGAHYYRKSSSVTFDIYEDAKSIKLWIGTYAAKGKTTTYNNFQFHPLLVKETEKEEFILNRNSEKTINRSKNHILQNINRADIQVNYSQNIINAIQSIANALVDLKNL